MDVEYIEKFYRMYFKDVYIYTFSLCRDRQLAEDIMKEALDDVKLSKYSK